MRQKQRKPSRRKVLISLGFRSYREYLASKLWKEIRQRVLDRDNSRCCRCGGLATQVHHGCYSLLALGGADISTLVCCCGGCHKFAEFHPDGRKARRGTANKKLAGTYDPSRKYRSRPQIGLTHAAKQKLKSQ